MIDNETRAKILRRRILFSGIGIATMADADAMQESVSDAGASPRTSAERLHLDRDATPESVELSE
jgi:hypothetical protein